MVIDSMEKLFHEELKDIYDAENRLTKALPKMAKAAKSPMLKSALEEHLEVTRTQIGRLDRIFAAIGEKPVPKTCKAMQGLVEEGDEAVQDEGPEPFTDLGIIGAARRVEHYEMAAYLTLQSLAENLDYPEVDELLALSLEEEGDADEVLADIASALMNDLTEVGDESPNPPAPEQTQAIAQAKADAQKITP